MKREKSIDILKGIGILLVILGHIQNYIPKNLLIYIYSFHMPLFFYISGFLYKEEYEKNLSIKEYAKKRFKQLIYPYITLSLINLIWLIIKEHSIEQIIKFILSFGYSNYIFDKNYVGAVWFLLCLFNVEMIYFIISKKFKIKRQIIIIILYIIGIIFSKFMIYRLPFWLDIALFGILFYHLGFMIKNRKEYNYTLIKKTFLLIIFIIVSIIGIVLNYKYCYSEKFLGRIDMLYLHFGNIFYFTITAISGIFTWHLVSNIIKENNILEWFGRNTLIIMGIHIIILQVLEFFINLIHIKNDIIIFLLLFIPTLIIIYISVNFMDRFLPWITNYKDFKKILERKN